MKNKLQRVRCLMCGEQMFSDAESYAKHVEAKHSLGSGIKIVPINTTGRTKAEIVADVEHRLRDFIMTPEEMKTPRRVHPDECRCVECFNAQLDRIIAGDHITWGEAPGHEQIIADAQNQVNG